MSLSITTPSVVIPSTAGSFSESKQFLREPSELLTVSEESRIDPPFPTPSAETPSAALPAFNPSLAVRTTSAYHVTASTHCVSPLVTSATSQRSKHSEIRFTVATEEDSAHSKYQSTASGSTITPSPSAPEFDAQKRPFGVLDEPLVESSPSTEAHSMASSDGIPSKPPSSSELRLVDEDHLSERVVLRSHGFQKLRTLTSTLQGTVFLAADSDGADGSGSPVVIKRTAKLLHKKGITKRIGGRVYSVDENVLKEHRIMSRFCRAANCPNHITRTLGLFESAQNYYLAMEWAGDDFLKFVVKAHRLISAGKLPLRNWRKFAKFLFYQMAYTVHWLHSEMDCCHLDISLENMAVQNGEFLPLEDGSFAIDRRARVKFIDFGLAEFFERGHAAESGFRCKKYCGKRQYKSPEVYRESTAFDARKADVWSLGVVLFSLCIGAPPFERPSRSDDTFQYFERGSIAKLLRSWKREKYATNRLVHLLQGMLSVDPSQRYLMEDVLRHRWVSVYYQQYVSSGGHRAVQKKRMERQRAASDSRSFYKLPAGKLDAFGIPRF